MRPSRMSTRSLVALPVVGSSTPGASRGVDVDYVEGDVRLLPWDG